MYCYRPRLGNIGKNPLLPAALLSWELVVPAETKYSMLAYFIHVKY